MKTSLIRVAASIALVFAATFSAQDACAASPNEAAVQEATAGFYKAINAMFEGDIEPMKEVWSHADDITYMGPDGTVEVGWEKTLADLNGQAKMKLGGEIRHEQIMLKVGPELAVMECREIGQNVVDGEPVKVSLRATNVFRKEHGVWKLVGHHTDKLPFLE
ncbi:MAG: DUF4440 domain-containing protein [Planctomycetota bacterium]|nr:MAG: DUF4440 domain-containing protein [Planctomycetota bacterium]